MKKFTKEIMSLLASVAVGVSMGTSSASAEENVQLSGQALNPDSFTEPAEEEMVPTSGVVVSDRDITESATATNIIPPLEGTVVATTTTTTAIPPLEGTVVGTTTTTTDIPPLAGTVVGTTTTTTAIPPLEGTVVGTTTTTTDIPPLAGTVVGTTTTTTAIPPLEGTVVGTTTTTTDIPPLMGDMALADGDTNCDGQLDMADAVLIMQALANPNKYGENGTSEYHLTAQGKYNGDMDGDGLTVGDAQKIQMKLLGLNDEKIKDLETINSMLTKFFEENDFYANSVLREYDEYSCVEVIYNSRIPDLQNNIEEFITDKNIDKRLIEYTVLL